MGLNFMNLNKNFDFPTWKKEGSHYVSLQVHNRLQLTTVKKIHILKNGSLRYSQTHRLQCKQNRAMKRLVSNNSLRKMISYFPVRRDRYFYLCATLFSSFKYKAQVLFALEEFIYRSRIKFWVFLAVRLCVPC